MYQYFKCLYLHFTKFFLLWTKERVVHSWFVFVVVHFKLHDKLILRKIIKIVATRSQILHLKHIYSTSVKDPFQTHLGELCQRSASGRCAKDSVFRMKYCGDRPSSGSFAGIANWQRNTIQCTSHTPVIERLQTGVVTRRKCVFHGVVAGARCNEGVRHGPVILSLTLTSIWLGVRRRIAWTMLYTEPRPTTYMYNNYAVPRQHCVWNNSLVGTVPASKVCDCLDVIQSL